MDCSRRFAFSASQARPHVSSESRSPLLAASAGDDVLGKQPEPLASVTITPSISARSIGAAQPDELRHQRLDMTGGEGDGGPASDRRRGPVAAGRRTTRGLPRPLPWAGGGGPADDSGPLLAAVWA